MHSFSLVYRSRVSIGLCKPFTLWNNQSARLSQGAHVRSLYTTAISQNTAIGQIKTKVKSNASNKNSEKEEHSSIKDSTGTKSLGGTKSSAQKASDHTDDKSETGTANDPNKKPYTDEFNSMVEQFGWSKDSKEYEIARKKLNNASVLQFNANFDEEDKSSKKGSKSKKGSTLKSEKESKSEKERKAKAKKEKEMLPQWIKLFSRIDIKDPIMPKTVPEFEERVQSVHTNICDVIHTDVSGGKSTNWENEVLLSEYTRRTRKFFRRDHPLAGTLLRYLFRHIWFPSKTRGFEKKAETKERK
ncbi:hypothetical protein RSOLAG22IIIB_07204 [Rhizoctonia solani]|uniref:Uncharacterized protein n=1 Tax=Rhizoctonia solani TaxID=456999 RepID=A0A0K6FLI1_9AGAM|nr:hypothetical protein RSOLAG22IIIB_07204 [Rhizoctonia solani]